MKLNESSFFIKYKRQLIFGIIMMLAAVVRFVLFSNHPGGLNQDEASIGYEAWAIMNYGIDRNGMSMPVHLLAWGSGQNTLYAYFSMPFIKLFGLNVFSMRIVNLLFSLLSIPAIYGIMRRASNAKTALIACAVLAISPWNIMLSRWGLESNLFPSLFIIAVYFFVLSLKSKWFLVVSAFIFALTLYSYGAAYLVVTLFCFVCFLFIIAKRLVPLKVCFISLGVFLLISLPIYLFVIINAFDLNQISIGMLTIPKMHSSRMSLLTDGITMQSVFKNIFHLFILQDDGIPLFDQNNVSANVIPIFGCFYAISMPFLIYGVIISIKHRSEHDFIALAALASSFALLIIYSSANTNRVNVLYITMIYFIARGISAVIKNHSSFIAITCTYAIFFTCFCSVYFGQEYREKIADRFYVSFGDALEKADEIAQEDDTIYITSYANMPYIYVLFYNKVPPADFHNTAVYENYGAFESVTSFDRYIIGAHAPTEDAVFVIANHELDYYDTTYRDVYTFENYSVIAPYEN